MKLDGNPGTANQLGSTAHLNLLWNMNYRTFPNAPTANTLQLPFNLTQEQLKKLEKAREDSHQGRFTLYVELEGVLEAVRKGPKSQMRDGKADKMAC